MDSEGIGIEGITLSWYVPVPPATPPASWLTMVAPIGTRPVVSLTVCPTASAPLESTVTSMYPFWSTCAVKIAVFRASVP